MKNNKNQQKLLYRNLNCAQIINKVCISCCLYIEIIEYKKIYQKI